MRTAAAILAVLAATIAPARGQSSADATRASAIVDAVASVCPVHADPTSLSADALFVSGPPPGTHHAGANVGNERMTVVYRPEPGGFCAVRFQPAPDIEAALARLLQVEAKRGDGGTVMFLVRRADGKEAHVIYTPYVAGRTGPLWLRSRSGHLFGFDSAAREDTIVVYFP